MKNKKLSCKKCGSENINIQRISITKNKKKGIFYWLFFGWLIDLFLWLFLTLPRLIFAIFRPRKVKTKVHSEAVCQNCGYSWKV
jgi:predicted nucleic-acid-binding Zn-ribbon protein